MDRIKHQVCIFAVCFGCESDVVGCCNGFAAVEISQLVHRGRRGRSGKHRRGFVSHDGPRPRCAGARYSKSRPFVFQNRACGHVAQAPLGLHHREGMSWKLVSHRRQAHRSDAIAKQHGLHAHHRLPLATWSATAVRAGRIMARARVREPSNRPKDALRVHKALVTP